MKFAFALLIVPTFVTAAEIVPTQAVQAVAFYHGCMLGVLSTDTQQKTAASFNETSLYCAVIMRESEIDRTYLNQPGVMAAMATAFARIDDSLKKVFLK
jgi:hypothetical protein